MIKLGLIITDTDKPGMANIRMENSNPLEVAHLMIELNAIIDRLGIEYPESKKISDINHKVIVFEDKQKEEDTP